MESSAEDKGGRWLLELVLLAALGLALRLFALGQEALWADEFYTLRTISQPEPGAVLEHMRTADPHPPFYFLLLHIWTQFVGDSDLILRLPSALAGAVLVPMVYLLARRLWPGQRRYAVVAAALVAVSPMQIWYAQEARSYALLVLLQMVGFLGVGGALTAHGGRRRAAAVLLAAISFIASVYTHYFGVFGAAGGCLALLLGGEGSWRARFRSTAGLAVPVALGVAPAVWSAASTLRSGRGVSWLPPFKLVHLLDVATAQFLGPLYTPLPLWAKGAALLAATALLIFAICELAKLRRQDRAAWGVLMAGLGCCLVLPVLLALGGVRILFFGQRYLLIANPFVLMTAALAVHRVGHGWQRHVARTCCLLVLLAQAYWLSDYYRFRQKHLWDVAAEFLTKHTAPNAQIVVAPARLAGLQQRYLPKERSAHGLEPGEVPAFLKAGHRPAAVVFSFNPAATLEQAGITIDQVGVAELTTHRPGQDLWIVVLP